MIAGFAMLVLALGALIMVLCVGFGDAGDEEDDGAADPRQDDPLSPEGNAPLRPLRGRGFRLG
ncbi:MAG: hypothetical protein GEV04_03520 [Actinophytocola sp.]|nr:hypothetical protein [Actinophytocola sp.]